MGRVLAAVDIKQTVEHWPEKLSMPPEEEFDDLIEDVGELVGSTPENPHWVVIFRLWSADDVEGPIDMVLKLELRETDTEYYKITYLDLDVP